MTDNQDPRRMREMMGDLASRKPDSIDSKVQGEDTSNSTQLEFITRCKSYITLSCYLGKHQELKMDYEISSRYGVVGGEVDDIETIQNSGFCLMGPNVKKLVPGLDENKMIITAYRKYSVRIPDTGEGGVYSVQLFNQAHDCPDAKVKLTFSTGVWIVK